MLADIGEEDRRRHRLEGVALEPALEPGVEALAADRDLDAAQEGGALFVGDFGQAIVGVAPLEVDVQPRVGRRQRLHLLVAANRSPSAYCCAATLGP